MEELRLPWNEKEGLLYGSVIALITAFLMSSINIIDNTGTLDLNTACAQAAGYEMADSHVKLARGEDA